MANGEYDGHTPHPYQSAPEEKSMGHEHTFDVDEGDTEAIFATVLKLSGKVARRLRQGKYECKRITLKIRYNDFSTFTHQITLDHFTNDEGDIYRNALKCYREAYSGGRKLRLIGVRGSILKPTADSYSTFQPDIFQSSLMTKKHCVLRAADTIRDKFGEKALFYCGIAEAR
jgi:DNA polymerase-4